VSILNTPGAVGTWVKLPTIESVQILAHAGYDFVVIDQEHAPIDIRTAYQLVNTAAAEGLLALVRVDELRPASIQRILDAGAAGVLVPHIDTPEQAELAARSVRFPPFGIRGAGGTSRAGRWGTLPTADYLASGNSGALCIPQLESKLAIDNVEKIAAVDGIDALFVGVADLSMDMGTTPSDPEVVRLYLHALEAAHQAGKPCGFASGSAAGARAALDQGFDFVMASSDTAMLVAEASGVVGAVRGARRS
jgi:2-keto-3-deoxy-L-rhamnonate aldolase RhmA